MEKSVIERAYELARSGSMANVPAIQAQLNKEGYSLAYGHLSGFSTKKDLRALIAEARKTDHL